MIGINTNILVRYLSNDEEEQFILATNLLENYLGQEDSIFINNIVLCELVWVLIRAYRYEKAEVIRILKMLVSSIEFCFENQSLVYRALIEFEKNSADFSDILIGLVNNSFSCTKTFSFDKKTQKLNTFAKVD